MHNAVFCESGTKASLFVSPELSSGRDLVIQMRRAASVYFFFFFFFFCLRKCMHYLDDIWYVGWARAEVVHAEFWAWHMLIKYLNCLTYAKNLSGAFLENRMLHLDDIWYVGRARTEGAYSEFWAWHMLVPWDPWGQKC